MSMFWKPGAVKGAILSTLVLLSLVFAIVFVISHGRGAGRNSIEAVQDRRFFSDYSIPQATALAGCGDWLAIGTTDGLTVMNIPTRLPFENIIDKPILDVRCDAENFYVLDDTQVVSRVFPNQNMDSEIWIPSPPNPTLPISSTASDTIIANTVDDEGWLAVFEDYGVARYVFEELSNGTLARTRDWEPSDLWNVEIVDAHITQEGIWAYTPDGNLHYVNRETINQEQTRRLDIGAMSRFDAGYDEDWAGGDKRR